MLYTINKSLRAKSITYIFHVELKYYEQLDSIPILNEVTFYLKLSVMEFDISATVFSWE